jgi:hypothetical protein
MRNYSISRNGFSHSARPSSLNTTSIFLLLPSAYLLPRRLLYPVCSRPTRFDAPTHPRHRTLRPRYGLLARPAAELANVRSLAIFSRAYFDELPVTSVEQHLGKMLAFLAFSELVIIALFDDPALVYRHSQQSVRHDQRERRCHHSR